MVSTNKIEVRMFTTTPLSRLRAFGRIGLRCWPAALALLSLLSLPPAHALSPSAYTSIATGTQHACGVLASGLVQCWGRNILGGPLGNNSTVSSSTAVDVIGVSNAVAVAAGDYHSCALIADGRMKCWGYNFNGQLGDGSVINRPVAVSVLNVTNATAIDARNNTTCALLATGDITCWGQDGATSASSSTPTTIIGFAGSTALSVGSAHVCAVRSSQVWCRGRNTYGQLGNNSTALSPVPVQALGIATGATSVSAGETHTCAVVSGAAYCWGNNPAGQIGDGTLIGPRLSPTLVSGLSAVATITARYSNTCAVLTGGALRCWGANDNGRLGNTGSGSAAAVAVNGIADALQVRLGIDFTCVLRISGIVDCWGANADGQLGNGATLQSNVPVRVGNLNGVTWISAGYQGACAVSGGGALACWGNNRGDGDSSIATAALPATVPGISTATSVSVGSYSSCVRLDTGALMCWGSGDKGQLGTGNTTTSNVPVAGVASAAQVSGGSDFFCAIVSTFTSESVWCWGAGTNGQLGNGTNGNSNVAAATGIIGSKLVLGSPYPISVAAGGAHACAVLATGAVKCWGYGSNGAISNGTGSSNVPITVALLPATQITAGADHSCARLTDGRVACWGTNRAGQLGRGVVFNVPDPNPSFVLGITNAVSVAAVPASLGNYSPTGSDHTCALLADGRVKCWGDNTTGQLGNGSTVSSAEPVFVTGITTATQIAVGTGFSCALLADTTVKCWGINQSGVLGDGNGPVLQLAPTPVLPKSCSMDIDGDGVVSLTTDSVLLARATAGMSGTTVTNNAIGTQATRRTWSGIRAYLKGPCGMQGLAP
jgi:alpha-tubulin suppressor-like RCC1 family protein